MIWACETLKKAPIIFSSFIVISFSIAFHWPPCDCILKKTLDIENIAFLLASSAIFIVSFAYKIRESHNRRRNLNVYVQQQ